MEKILKLMEATDPDFKQARAKKVKPVDITKDEVNESSLSRILDHLENHDVAIITAFRDVLNVCHNEKCHKPDDYTDKTGNTPLTDKQNLKRNSLLYAAMMQKAYAITKVDGTYIEKFGEEAAKHVNENSFFVVNINNNPKFADTIVKLGKYFCQDSVLIKLKGENAYLHGTNNANFPGMDDKFTLNNFKGGVEAEFMTKVRNRPFVFEHIMTTVGTNMGRFGIIVAARPVVEALETM